MIHTYTHIFYVYKSVCFVQATAYSDVNVYILQHIHTCANAYIPHCMYFRLYAYRLQHTVMSHYMYFRLYAYRIQHIVMSHYICILDCMYTGYAYSVVNVYVQHVFKHVCNLCVCRHTRV